MRKLSSIIIGVVILSAGVSAWVRQSPARNQVAAGVNVERIATDFRIVNLGEKSVLLPSDEGGTGQRFMAETWALQVRSANGVWADLIWVWGATDDVVPYLQTKQREEEARVDLLMFNQSGYLPHVPFPRAQP
jgi:hypothetical protein